MDGFVAVDALTGRLGIDVDGCIQQSQIYKILNEMARKDPFCN